MCLRMIGSQQALLPLPNGDTTFRESVTVRRGGRNRLLAAFLLNTRQLDRGVYFPKLFFPA